MCSKIVIVDELTGEVTDVAQTVGELKKLGIDPVLNKYFKSYSYVSCFCCLDLDKTAKYNGFTYTSNGSVHTFIFDDAAECTGDCDTCGIECEDRYDKEYCNICGEDECDCSCEDEDNEDNEDEEMDEQCIQYSEWSPVQWPDSNNWFVADSAGKTVCVFNNENVDTKEAAELISIAPEMLHIIQIYYTGKNDTINTAIAKNFLKKFKMID